MANARIADALVAQAADFRNGAAFVDGRVVPVEQATISVLDWGFLHSDATYDVAHVWNGRFFRLRDHLARFTRGMERLRMSIPHDVEEIEGILRSCVSATGLKNAYVEMICTRGVPPPGSRDPRECTNRFLAFIVPFIWVANPEQRERGLRLRISHVQRIAPGAVDPTVKNYHWLDLVAGLFEAYDAADETVVLVDMDGNVTEGPGFNVFAAIDGELVTPAMGVLEGVTRRTVIEIARELRVPMRLRPLKASELRSAAEVFISSTAGGIMPIGMVDGVALGTSGMGPITRKIADRYWALHEDPRYSTAV